MRARTCEIVCVHTHTHTHKALQQSLSPIPQTLCQVYQKPKAVEIDYTGLRKLSFQEEVMKYGILVRLTHSAKLNYVH